MKKGFTLIELLAVIVILAIIALIATPIVLSIISDSKESAGLRSAEMYLDAVEQSISLEKMKNTNFNPNSCDITKEGNLYCDGKDMIKVEVNGEVPVDGSITFVEGKITDIRLKYNNDKIVVKDENENLVYEIKLAPGLYDEDGNMTMSWEELLNDEILFVNNGELVADIFPNENYEIPGNNALVGKLVISNNVTSIGEEAFMGCGLTSIEIPDSVTSIGDYAFQSCSNLTSIEIPDSVTSIGDGAFCACESLPSIEIPDSVTSIGDSAFYMCESLTSIEIPDSVTNIGFQVFKYCPNLTTVTIPDSVTSIGDEAFNGCSLTSITIPNSVANIGEYAFTFCQNLTEITIPNSVANIGEEAFASCPNLTKINYNGTKAQWNTVTKGDAWNDYCPQITVHCTDGDIIIPAFTI